MSNTGMIRVLGAVVALCFSHAAVAALASSDQPIEISSDTLDVFQNEHKAVFSGNVIAVQGTTNMRAGKMTVYYRDGGDKKAAAPADAGQGISRIDAEGAVVFTTPKETAQGDKGVYNVDTDTIDLTGANVTLTREQNVLKGTHLTYNMKTGRSMLTSGSGQVTGSGSKKTRVHGLFVPKSDKGKTGQ
jgi:lipopolysaccharide export system protein LptA